MVPSLLEKLPEQLRLTITRGEDHHEWNLEPLSDILGHEVELREEYHRNPRNTRNPQDEFKRKTSMHTGKQINCDLCLWGHNHEECKKVKGRGKSENLGNHSTGESVGNNTHVETGKSVVLQTAQAQIAGKGNARIRMIFDTESHTSFVTSRVAKGFSLEILRKEWLAVNTFGQRAAGSNLREVIGCIWPQ